jgi:hypothetical protein
MVGDGGGNPHFFKMSAVTTDREQSTPADTRFLLSQYSSNPNQRLHLAPGASYRFYAVIFMGNDLPALKTRSTEIRGFIADNMAVSPTADLTCIPYVTSTEEIGSPLLMVRWHSYTDPDYFRVYYKVDGAPASSWEYLLAPGDFRSASLTLTPNTWYDIKVGSIYMVQGQEVYLESQTVTVPAYVVIPADDPLAPVVQLSCHPNPVSSFARIDCTLLKGGRASLCVYNQRGQRVRKLEECELGPGYHSFEWDAKDDNGYPVSSGVYYLRLDNHDSEQIRKIAVIR